jgi:hypothetical protein
MTGAAAFAQHTVPSTCLAFLDRRHIFLCVRRMHPAGFTFRQQ